MPEPAPANSAPLKLPTEMTAQKIIKIFVDLGLPVCDDAAMIQQKVDAQRPHMLRLKNSTDPNARAAAVEWFENVNYLKNRLADVLNVVYDQFENQASLAIEAGVASGKTTLTQGMMDALANVARDGCRLSNDLTLRFVERYVKKRGLKAGGVLQEPANVEDFSATSTARCISLRWCSPTKNYTEIEINRQEDAPGAAPKKPKKVYNGTNTRFEDSDVSPGKWYTYRARVILNGVKGVESVVRVPCLGEVRKLAADTASGKVMLTWELPFPDACVWVFRREGGPPDFRKGPNQLEPADKQTKVVFCGNRPGCGDADVVEGAEYQYRIVVDFDGGRFTEGLVLPVRMPRCPPSVPAVRAEHKSNAGKDEVALEWDAVPGRVPVKYVVVRREGGTPPATVKDGVLVAETQQLRCYDTRVVPGARYTYAVFSRQGDMDSARGTAAPSVDVLAEVLDPHVHAGDGVVQLEWRDPPASGRLSRIIIRRCLSVPPRDANDGELIRPLASGQARDDGLRNGHRYCYRICCAYKPDGAREEVSVGLTLDAVPDRYPDPVLDFQAQLQGRQVVATWTQPAHGDVMVLRSAQPHGLPVGARLEANRAKTLGDIIVATAGRAVDASPDSAKLHYSIFTISGSHAVAGGTEVCAVVPDVTGLRWYPNMGEVVLTWTWPAGCKSVVVARRDNESPEGPEDRRATRTPWTLDQYGSAGNRYIDKPTDPKVRYHYVVYAQVSAGGARHHAPGSMPGCRAVVPGQGAWMVLSYKFSSPKWGRRKGKYIQLVWKVEQPLPDFAGFALLADQTQVPTSLHQDLALYRWIPDRPVEEGTYDAWVSLDPIRKRGWPFFYCKAALVDPSQQSSVLMVHRNTCIATTSTGEMQLSQTPPHAQYDAKVPKNFVCPECFDRFKVEEMRFASEKKGKQIQGRRSWLDGLLRRPTKPPKDDHGRRMVFKFCPKGHLQPFTAGLHQSLTIGLIGATFSGKSHFVAALVSRLQERAGDDLWAALLPVTDETSKRYRDDFETPLIKGRRQLDKTAGTPPPLIYNLSFDRRLWNEKRTRSVNLALYDTAGENLDDGDTARQMVQYLSVASGIMFLLDPLQVKGVRDALGPGASLPAQNDRATPQGIIGNVFSILKESEHVSQDEMLAIPVAVVLTKCDVLRDAGLIEPNRLWCMEKRRHIGRFNEEWHNDMSGMLGEYVRRWAPSAYNMITHSFPNHAFFGVSSTGCAPDRLGRFEFVSPFRVEDPLLWLLAQLRVLPVE